MWTRGKGRIRRGDGQKDAQVGKNDRPRLPPASTSAVRRRPTHFFHLSIRYSCRNARYNGGSSGRKCRDYVSPLNPKVQRHRSPPKIANISTSTLSCGPDNLQSQGALKAAPCSLVIAPAVAENIALNEIRLIALLRTGGELALGSGGGERAIARSRRAGPRPCGIT
jgi:hypothetical protein